MFYLQEIFVIIFMYFIEYIQLSNLFYEIYFNFVFYSIKKSIGFGHK